MRTVLVGITDQHAMSSVGLLNPETVLFRKGEGGDLEEYTPDLTPDQYRLWNQYITIKDEAVRFAGKDPICLINLGDQTEGTYWGIDVKSVKYSDHIIAALANMAPWMNVPNVNWIRLVPGNRSHEQGEANTTALVTHYLKENHPEMDIRPVYHGLIGFGKLNIDYTHVGPSGSSRWWLDGNQARYYLISDMAREIAAGREPAHLYLRGHFHTLINEVVTKYAKIEDVDKWLESRIVVVPPLCLMGDHSRKVTRSAHIVTFGGVMFEVIDEFISPPIFITQTMDIRVEENLWTKKKFGEKLKTLITK